MPRGIPRAKDNPVALSKTIEASEQPLGHTVRNGDPNATTAQGRIGTPQLIQVAERMPDPEKAANLAFMDEMVTIRIGTASDPNAEQVFELNIAGRSELFRRGETKRVRRFYVDHMARMKVTAYSQKEVFNAEGIKQYLNVPHTALKYDFAMVRDDNPMGESWLKATLAMGG
jgi:hypothetical protein